MEIFNRYSGNPVLKPNPFNTWEALNVFNAGIVYHNGLFHMLYRAQGIDYISHIGYAVSEDGYHWSRLDKPVLSPANKFETRGVEDPRITWLEGKFYMTYTAYSPIGIRAAIAESENLITWNRMGILLPDEDNKDTAIFPQRIGGRYCMLHRREPDIWLAYSDDLLHWTDHQKIMGPIANTWEHTKVGISGPPILTEQGWLLVYHGVDKSMVYRQGVSLLDLENPTMVKCRVEKPVLEPTEAWEIKGDVPNVIFSCGQIVKEGILYVYYGGADRVMAVATVPLEDLLKLVSG